MTVRELVDEYLGQHIAEDNTIATLTFRLRHVTSAVGDQRLDRLHVPEVAAWRKRLPEGSAWHIMNALRQVLHYAVRCGYAQENVAVKVNNPEPKTTGWLKEGSSLRCCPPIVRALGLRRRRACPCRSV